MVAGWIVTEPDVLRAVTEVAQMPRREIRRDYVVGDLDAELVRQRQSAGWRLVAVEWEREAAESALREGLEAPYGMRVAGDCRHLEEDPEEGEVLRTVMRMVVQDEPLWKITEELNKAGRRTRAGKTWTVTDVFRLMPVLVESGPRVFADPSWTAARTH
jgi:hypothetical protein